MSKMESNIYRAFSNHRKVESAIPFSRFDADISIRFDTEASDALGKDYWRVLDSFKFYTEKMGQITHWVLVPGGFLTDGATVPRMFWSLASPWERYSQAAAMHDYLCEYGIAYCDGNEVKVTRRQADRIFLEGLKAAKISRWRRGLMYTAVRIWSVLGRRPSPEYLAAKRKLEVEWEYA